MNTVSPDVLDIMCLLRESGWLVALKCIPDLQPWLGEIDDGQYEAISRRRWSCEAQWLGREWRHSQIGFGEHPRDAILKVYGLIAEDEVRRNTRK